MQNKSSTYFINSSPTLKCKLKYKNPNVYTANRFRDTFKKDPTAKHKLGSPMLNRYAKQDKKDNHQ